MAEDAEEGVGAEKGAFQLVEFQQHEFGETTSRAIGAIGLRRPERVNAVFCDLSFIKLHAAT